MGKTTAKTGPKKTGVHHSQLAGFIIDCKTKNLSKATKFWSGALGMPVQPLPKEENKKYRQLDGEKRHMHVEIQRVKHKSRLHLDIETDDIKAEVKRLKKLGAVTIKKVKTWVVMEAPTGQRFCVIRAQNKNFAQSANRWG